MVELDDLAFGHLGRGLLGKTHHQHGADGEVRCDEAARALAAIPGLVGRGANACQLEPRGPDDDVDVGRKTLTSILDRGLGRAEVDHDVGVAQRVSKRELQRRVGASRERHVLGIVYRGANGLPHAPRSA